MVKPVVTAIDMGYGHLRPAAALADHLATEVVQMDASPFGTRRDRAFWTGIRKFYEPLTRMSQVGAAAGLMRALLNNMVSGVTKGFEKKLNLVGVGFRAQAAGRKLNLQIGFSHPVNKEMPTGITVQTPTQTEILIKGADRQVVGQIAAEVRAIRPPEPYKGKGIRYADEKVSLKETKKK